LILENDEGKQIWFAVRNGNAHAGDRLNVINEMNTVYGRNIRNISEDEVKEGCRMSSHMSEVSSHLYIFVL